MYIKCHAEAAIMEMSKMFGAVSVTGSRQAAELLIVK